MKRIGISESLSEAHVKSGTNSENVMEMVVP